VNRVRVTVQLERLAPTGLPYGRVEESEVLTAHACSWGAHVAAAESLAKRTGERLERDT
jgi:hypothetical protein